jgi:hypothetical protein
MTKTRQDVHTYRIDKKCDVCKTGNLITTGNGYEHKCDNTDCGILVTLTEIYPEFVTEAIGAVEIIGD